MTRLSPVWFMRKPVDFEHHQYVLLAYLQKVSASFDQLRVWPEMVDLKRDGQNLESFLNSRIVLDDSTLSDADAEILWKASRLPEGDAELDVMLDVAKWALPRVNDEYRRGSAVWRKIESSVNIYYIDENNKNRRGDGMLLVRYAGAPVVEAYSFTLDGRRPIAANVKSELVGYYESTSSDYTDVRHSLVRDGRATSSTVFVAAESDISFSTVHSVIPVIRPTLAKVVGSGG